MLRDAADTDKILRKARLFEALSDDRRAQAMAAMHVIAVSADEMLFSIGDAADAVYLIVSGEIGIEVTAEDGRTIRIATKGAGEVFGEIAALDGGARSATARAVTASKVLALSISVFTRLAEASPDFMMAIIRDLAGNIRNTDRLLTAYIIDSLERRVASALLDLAMKAGGAGAILRLTQLELANRLLATRERVNRELTALARENIITLGRGKIIVHDIFALKRRCNSEI